MWLGDLGLAIWVTVIINIINFIVNIVTMLIVTPWKPLEIFLVIFTFCLGIRGCVWSLQRVVLRGWRWPELLRLHLLHVRLRPPHPPLGKHWELLRNSKLECLILATIEFFSWSCPSQSAAAAWSWCARVAPRETRPAKPQKAPWSPPRPASRPTCGINIGVAVSIFCSASVFSEYELTHCNLCKLCPIKMWQYFEKATSLIPKVWHWNTQLGQKEQKQKPFESGQNVFSPMYVPTLLNT